MSATLTGVAKDDESRRVRSAMKRRMRELSRRLDQWDPIGVYGLGEPWPAGEYDCLVGPTMRKLHDGSSAVEIADMLAHELVDHFGLSPAAPPVALASELRLWWDGELGSGDESPPSRGGTP